MANLTQYTGGKLANFVTALTQLQQAAPAVSEGGIPYLKQNDKGAWTYGQEDTPLTSTALLAANPASFGFGFIAWKAKKPIAEVMSSLGEPPIDPTELPPVDCLNGWEEQAGVSLIVDDSDNAAEVGTVVMWKATSKGGREAITKLLNEVVKRAQAGEPCVPLITLGHTSYEHKVHGKVIKPAVTITDWISLDELDELHGQKLKGVSLTTKKLPQIAAPVAPPPVEAPAGRRSRAAAPAPADNVVDINPLTGEIDEGDDTAQTPTAADDRRRAAAEGAAEPPRRARSRSVTDDIVAAGAGADEPPFDVDPPASEPPRRRRRV